MTTATRINCDFCGVVKEQGEQGWVIMENADYRTAAGDLCLKCHRRLFVVPEVSDCD